MRKTFELGKIIYKLLGLLYSFKYTLILAIIFGALGNIVATLIPGVAGMEIAKLLDGSAISLARFSVVIVVLAVLRAVLRYLEQLVNHYVAFKTLHIIRDKVFKSLRKLSPAKLDGKDKGELISLITTDIELLEVFYAHTISPVFIALLHTLFFALFLRTIDTSLAWLLVAFHLVLATIVPWVSAQNTQNVGKVQREKLSRLNSFILQTFQGIKECIQFGYGAKRMEDVNKQTDALNKENKTLALISAKNMSLSLIVVLLGNLSVLLLCAKLLEMGSINLGQAVIAIVIFVSSFGPTSALSNLVNNLIITFSCGKRVLDLLDEEPLVEDIVGKKNVEFKSIATEHLHFAYQNETLLENVNLSLKQGEILGIEGKSGAGKSTLLKLLMRFYKPSQGSIVMNGENIEDINTTSLRHAESYVSQDTYLFSGSILDNLKIAKPNASQEEIEKACVKASIHEFITSLPQGYDTKIDSLGHALSTGETQRIALARAFLNDAKLMLLDEPTSNIDGINEGMILKALYEHAKEKAIIIVSHRKSTLRITDNILKLTRKTES